MSANSRIDRLSAAWERSGEREPGPLRARPGDLLGRGSSAGRDDLAQGALQDCGARPGGGRHLDSPGNDHAPEFDQIRHERLSWFRSPSTSTHSLSPPGRYRPKSEGVAARSPSRKEVSGIYYDGQGKRPAILIVKHSSNLGESEINPTESMALIYANSRVFKVETTLRHFYSPPGRAECTHGDALNYRSYSRPVGSLG